MSISYNVYCDESCYLENDKQAVMVLAAVWCPTEKAREIAVRLREIKQRHGLSPSFEMKWSKVSPAKLHFYLDIVDYFFDTGDLHFRGLIADKAGLRHADFNQDHDSWYYKMYFLALQNIFQPNNTYRIYIDVKDTRGGEKLRTLEDVLCNNMYDFRREVLQRVQGVHSHEVEQVQLADVLAGVVSYANRNLDSSSAKNTLVQRVRVRSGYSLLKTTLLREEKFNIFHWQPEPKG
jgi:hypothetical protein